QAPSTGVQTSELAHRGSLRGWSAVCADAKPVPAAPRATSQPRDLAHNGGAGAGASELDQPPDGYCAANHDRPAAGAVVLPCGWVGGEGPRLGRSSRLPWASEVPALSP